jgi:hypothetical protein
MNNNILDRFELVQCAIPANLQEQRVTSLPCVGRFAFSFNGKFVGFFRQGSTTLSRLSNTGELYDGVNVQVWRVPQDFLGVQTTVCGINLFGDDQKAEQHTVFVKRQFESDGSNRQTDNRYPDAYCQFDTDRDDLPYKDEDYVELKRLGVFRA